MNASPTLQPQPKVVAGGIGGSVAIVLVWALGQAGVNMPPEVAAAVSAILGFVAAYLTSNK